MSLIRPLLDFSFEKFITLSVLKIVYGFALALEVLAAIFFLIQGFSLSFGAGVAAVVLAPVLLVIAAILTRIYMELIAVLFRIANNTSVLAADVSRDPR